MRNSTIYFKLLGFLLKKGRKKIAKSILDNSILRTSKKLNIPSTLILFKIFSILNTFIEIKKINFRKRSHIVPFIVDYHRRSYLIARWIFEVVKEDSRSISMVEKLSSEMISIITDNSSKTILRKKQNSKFALRNRSNVHFRWQ